MFGMGTGVTLSIRSPETCKQIRIQKFEFKELAFDSSILMGKRTSAQTCNEHKLFRYDQASRPISTGKLRALLPLHIPPINVVVFHGSLGSCDREI